MTAYSDLDTTVESFQRGAREHLPKPFDIDVAVTLIQRVIDEQQGNLDETTAKKNRTHYHDWGICSNARGVSSHR